MTEKADVSNPSPDPAEQCDAASYRSLVGTNIAAVTLPEEAGIRVIRPGQVVTMDFIPTRTNFELDGSGVIIRVYCG